MEFKRCSTLFPASLGSSYPHIGERALKSSRKMVWLEELRIEKSGLLFGDCKWKGFYNIFWYSFWLGRTTSIPLQYAQRLSLKLYENG